MSKDQFNNVHFKINYLNSILVFNVLLFFLIFSSFSLYEKQPKQLIKKIEGSFSLMQTDPLQNLYLVSEGTIKKFDKNGKITAVYSNPSLGSIFALDASDPFKLLVYYKDFNQILFLDNKLSEIRSPIHLDLLDLNFSELACTSSKGGFWIYDGQSFDISYFNANLQEEHSTAAINTYINENEVPNFITEKNNLLYINFPNLGILIFDNSGAYISTVSLNGLSCFQVKDNIISYLEKNSIIEFNYKLKLEEKTKISGYEDIICARKENDLIYALTKEYALILSNK